MASISLIIPAYNSQKYLSEAIESVLNQTVPDWECIIIDDGSKDNTYSIAEQYAQHDSRIHAHTQPNQGVSQARNHGLDLISSNTKYVLFLDSDDFLENNALEILMQALNNEPQASAAYGLSQDVDKNGKVITTDIKDMFGYQRYKIQGIRLVPVSDSEYTTFESLTVWPCIETPGQVLIWRNILDKVGYFDKNMVASEDWDLFIRLSLLGGLEFVKKVIVNKRTHGENVSANGKLMALGEPVIRRKLATSTSLTNGQRKVARIAHLYSCYVKLTWIKTDLINRRYIAAIKGVYRALRSFVRYVQIQYIKQY